MSTASTAPDWRAAASRRLRGSTSILCSLDFDGTLAPIRDRPDDARLPPSTRRTLIRLRDVDGVRVAIVSGRSLADLRDRVGLTGVAYAGNHGLEVRRGETTAVHPIARTRSTAIDQLCDRLEAALADESNWWVERKRLTASVHLRGTPEHRRRIADRVEAVASRRFPSSIAAKRGKRVVELRPAIDWGKGRAVRLLAAGMRGDPGLVHVGDDTTDEDAFEAITPEGLAIRVGSVEETSATVRLGGPSDVAAVLSWLVDSAPSLLEEGREGDGRRSW